MIGIYDSLNHCKPAVISRTLSSDDHNAYFHFNSVLVQAKRFFSIKNSMMLK